MRKNRCPVKLPHEMLYAFETKMNFLCIYHPNHLFLPKLPPSNIGKHLQCEGKKKLDFGNGGQNSANIRYLGKFGNLDHLSHQSDKFENLVGGHICNLP